jgi:hypothetical protein
MLTSNDLKRIVEDMKRAGDDLVEAIGDGKGMPVLVLATAICSADKARASLARRRGSVLQAKAGGR